MRAASILAPAVLLAQRRGLHGYSKTSVSRFMGLIKHCPMLGLPVPYIPPVVHLPIARSRYTNDLGGAARFALFLNNGFILEPTSPTRPRACKKSPLFTTGAIAPLALGLGANTAIFTVLDQVLLRPLPVKNPNELVILSTPGVARGMFEGDNSDRLFSRPLYLDLAGLHARCSTEFPRLASAPRRTLSSRGKANPSVPKSYPKISSMCSASRPARPLQSPRRRRDQERTSRRGPRLCALATALRR